MELTNQQLIIPKNNEKLLINIDDITYCKSDLGYTQIFINNTSPLCISKNLKQIENLFPENQFFRCHQSYLVNIKYINSFSRKGHYIKLTNGDRIRLSRRKHQEFIDFLKKISKKLTKNIENNTGYKE